MSLVALSGAARAGRPAGTRTESGTYTAAGVQGVLGLTAEGQENLGAVRLPGGSERFVSVDVADTSGRAVAGEVAQNLDSDSAPEISYTFCDGTPKPVKVTPGVTVVVYLYAGTCGTEVSAPTTGRVTAEFSRSR